MYYLKILLIASLFFACSDSSSKEQLATDMKSETIQDQPEKTRSNLPSRLEACEYFSIEEVAAFFDWNPQSVSQELMMELEKYNKTVCHHFTPESELFLLRVSWKSKKAQENKVLENQYKGYLEKGEKGLSYTSFNTTRGTESLFGTGPDRDGKTLYILRTRFDNEVEIVVEGGFFSSEIGAFKNKFHTILKKIK